MQIPGIDINPRNCERPFKGYPKLMFLSFVLRNKWYQKWDLRGRCIVNMIEKPEFESFKTFFFDNVKGWITCRAQVTNPEDVETYKWMLIGPSYIGPPPSNNIIYHNETFLTSNNSITFPAVYTYRENDYTVILELLDSSGKVIGINTDEFYITASKEKYKIEGIKELIFVTIIGWFINQWKTTWSNNPDRFAYKFVEKVLNSVLDWNSPLLSALVLRFLEFLISVNELKVWDKIPGE